MNNPENPDASSLHDKKENNIQQPVKERMELATGYAVLVRRAGGPVEQVISEIREVYQLDEEQAQKAWELSQEKFKKEHYRVTGDTIHNVSISVILGVLTIALYAVFLSQLSATVSIVLYVFCAICLLGLFSFIVQYSKLSFPQNVVAQKPDLLSSKWVPFEMSAEKNKVAQYAPLAIFTALMVGAMYWFHHNVFEEKEGRWVKGVIKAYGERGYTGSKSKSYYTILKLGDSEDEYRLFDRELKYSILPIDSFKLHQGQRVEIFVITPGWQGLGSGGFSILNMRQDGRLMTDLSRRNEIVRRQNLSAFWNALLVCAGVLTVSMANGFYLHKKHSKAVI